jgi:hypothetical protein
VADVWKPDVVEGISVSNMAISQSQHVQTKPTPPETCEILGPNYDILEHDEGHLILECYGSLGVSTRRGTWSLKEWHRT